MNEVIYVEIWKKLLKYQKQTFPNHNQTFRRFHQCWRKARQRASNKQKEVLEALIEMLKAHFVSFEDPIFNEMKWIEPKY